MTLEPDEKGAHKLIETPQLGHTKVKCVLVGDSCVGKTSLVVSYSTNGYPNEYIPTAFDNYSVIVTVDNQPVCLQLCDTAGQDDFNSLRTLCYPQTQVFLLCFNIVCPTSFLNITKKWLPEIRRYCPTSPILLIGTQCDLRNDVKVLIELANYNKQPVRESEAKQLAQQIDAVTYIECSALTQKNLKEVFDTALLTALRYQKSDTATQDNTTQKVSCDNKLVTTVGLNLGKKRGWKKFCCFF